MSTGTNTDEMSDGDVISALQDAFTGALVDEADCADCAGCGENVTAEQSGTSRGEVLMCADCADSMGRVERREAFEEAERQQAIEEHGEGALHWKIDEERWVERRMQALSSQDVGFRENVAKAVALHELGYSESGIAKKVGVGESTAGKYLDTARETYPGIMLRRVYDLDSVEDGVEDLPDPPQTECPVCLKERLHHPAIAKEMYPRWKNWGATAMLDNADKVCTWCFAVRIDGSWERMKALGDRAAELAQGGGSKSRSDYRDALSAGIEPGKTGDNSDRAADDADDLDW